MKNNNNFNGFNGYFRNRKVLITGHTGFKGSWLSIWLMRLGAGAAGYALDPYTDRDNFVLANLSKKMTDIRGDIRDFKKLNSIIEGYKPEIIFHLAAQPLVRLSYDIPRETIETNVMGTANVLESFRMSESANILIVITSDKCYENKENICGYRETDPMGGYDPYSASKGAAELISSAYMRSFFNPEDFNRHGKAMATVRAGNVIGGGDWAQDRLIPDCIRALEEGKPVEVRNPDAVRPWQHVLEPLYGYLLLASVINEDPSKYSGAWNFGPSADAADSAITVKELVEKVIKYYGKGVWKDVSKRGSRESSAFDAKSESEPHKHEAKLLNLNINKAVSVLGWKPKLNADEAVKLTVDYYKRCKESNENAYEICSEQIRMFTDK
ncbi:MAG: CDP-glucose 4,6-dehydratase [Candidatus Acididesulfobacter guangdongensis]|uniref:CDP-glucose 4,6-dehydratase n=1 Tax=Acididesulfobacter guangdongensis TaxID=2597225 RepID=A0A519BG40_ACIG2|nr:MAG: CDP-glucose 4,6-dehydratase [Candidatus Acididesulfobacter guangdongensis]